MNHYKIDLAITEGDQSDPDAGDLLFFGEDLFVLSHKPASIYCWGAQAVGCRHTWNGWHESIEQATIGLEPLPVGSTATINRWRGR